MFGMMGGERTPHPVAKLGETLMLGIRTLIVFTIAGK